MSPLKKLVAAALASLLALQGCAPPPSAPAPRSLPAPNHPIGITYHFVDSPQYGQAFPAIDDYFRGAPVVTIYDAQRNRFVQKRIVNNNKVLKILVREKDFWPEQSAHVTHYFMALRAHAESTTPPVGVAANDLWQDLYLRRAIAGAQRAVAEGKRIIVLVSIASLGVKGALRIWLHYMKVYDLWRYVDWIDLQDEPSWTWQQANGRVDQIKRLARLYGLQGMPPLSVTIADNLVDRTGPGTLDEMLKSRLDGISLEAYLPPAQWGNKSAAEVRQALTAKLIQLKNRCYARGKLVVITPAGYDRNGAWANKATLPVIQEVAWEQAATDPKVRHLLVFNWARSGLVSSSTQSAVQAQAARLKNSDSYPLTGRYQVLYEDEAAAALGVTVATPTWGSRPLPSWLYPLDQQNALWRPGMRDVHREIHAAIVGEEDE